MTSDVFALVLGAAFLHAALNAMVKVNADRLAMGADMIVTQVVIAVLALPFVEIPPLTAILTRTPAPMARLPTTLTSSKML